MFKINRLKDLPDRSKNSVVAIGNFDGVHLGHQALLNTAKDIARSKNAPCGLLTFEPHPRSLFRPDDPPFRITPYDVKMDRLEKMGLDFCISLPFDWDFASRSAENFVQDILMNGLGAQHVVIGFDFKFGQLRKGSAQTIEAAGLPVTSFDPVETKDGHKIASSAIRGHLRKGEIAEANDLLGWDWVLSGIIQKGDQRGHDLGYPTANFGLGDTIHPAYGVYAAWAQIEDEDTWHKAAVNIGIRPMFELREGRVEAHLLDFPDRDLYGKTLYLKPFKRLRSEAKFNSLEALITQMDEDCAQTRAVLSKK